LAVNKGLCGRSITPFPLGWGGEWKEKGKKLMDWETWQFNRIASEANSNSSNTDKETIKEKQRNA